ncbi:MAG: dehydrogenase/reductase SDR family protein 7B [Rhodothermales bacterium]|jgi:dehydrogenase/reductase SDR family protein 7B
MKLTDKIVWITGASSGIGAALAREYASRGARCVLSARGIERLHAVKNSCDRPGDHVVLPLDTSEFDTHEAAVEAAEKAAGPIDILVLNAGIGQRGSALETDLGVARRIMDVNFTGTISLAQASAKRMVSRRSGQIVVISSVLGRVAIPGSSAYSASKFALHGYFEALRGEIFPHNISVSLVCPGYINTELTLHALQEDGSKFDVIDHNHTYGMDADVCADKIVRAVMGQKPVFTVGGKETWAVPLARFFPGLTRRVGRRYIRK